MIKSVMIVLKHLNFGGTERYAINLANSLVKKGIDVTIVAGDGPYRPYISSKINLYVVSIGRRNGQKQLAEKTILKVAEKHKPQIIHAQCRNALVCSQLARRVLNIPVVSHEHLAYKDNEYEFVVDELTKGADYVFTIAPYIAKKLISNGFDSTKMKVLLNSVDVNDFAKVTQKERDNARSFHKINLLDRVVLCLSRIVSGKGIDTLIQAFKMVVLQVPNAKLIIAGDDEWNVTKPLIQRQIKRSGLSSNVFILPAQFNVRQFHCVADIFCYPPINRGMAVMEAMASSLPIVAKEAPNKPLVAVNGVTGLLTKTSTFTELADNLTVLLKDRRLSRKMGRAARARIVEKYNLENTVKKVLRVYRQTIKVHALYSQVNQPMGITKQSLQSSI